MYKSPGGLTHGKGVTESVRYLWVQSLSSLAYISSALMEFTETVNGEKYHTELGHSRRHTDFSDCMKFYDWLKVRNPFEVRSDNLFSLSSGVASIKGRDVVNCENAEEVGAAIHATFDNVEYNKCCLKRKEVITPLSSLQCKMPV